MLRDTNIPREVNQNSFRENAVVYFKMPQQSVSLTFIHHMENKSLLFKHFPENVVIYVFLFFSHSWHGKYLKIHSTACIDFSNYSMSELCEKSYWIFHWSEHGRVAFEIDWLCLWKLKDFRVRRPNQTRQVWDPKRGSWIRQLVFTTEPVSYKIRCFFLVLLSS